MKIIFSTLNSIHKNRKASVLIILMVLFLSVWATMLTEDFFLEQQHNKAQEQINNQLTTLSSKLQQSFNEIIANNEALAKTLEENPEKFNKLDQHKELLKEIKNTNHDLLTISFATDYKIIHVHPIQGNESTIGTDYRFRPEFMRSIRRAVESRKTVITSSVPLIQSSKAGLIIRTPVFSQEKYIGLVSSIIELDALLEESGYKAQDYQLLIQAQTQTRGQYMVLGEFHDFIELGFGNNLNLPEQSIWELRAKPIDAAPVAFDVVSQIRLVSAILTTLIIFIMLRHSLTTKKLVFSHNGIALRVILLSLLMMPILLLIILAEVFYLSTLQNNSDRHLELIGNNQMRQMQDQVKSFFDVPKQAIHASVLFQQEIISLERPMEFLSFFVAQMRVQPQLTFLSVANTDGEYYAVSRPPTGTDRNLRMQWANLDTNRQMHIQWADDSNKPSDIFNLGNKNFDARTKSWFISAKNKGNMHWYPAYGYSTNDERKQYDALGIGISAPIYTNDNQFAGVMTADMALSQLNTFLEQQAKTTESTLFLMEKNGELLALSTQDPLYIKGDKGETKRIKAMQSNNPLISQAAEIIHKSTAMGLGQSFLQFEGKKHLVTWTQLDIPDGPSLTLGLTICSNSIEAQTNQYWKDGLYLGWLLLIFSAIIAYFATERVTRPLQAIESWASRLRAGEMSVSIPPTGRILEIASLSRSLKGMALQLQHHTRSLEKLVEKRTQELSDANEELERLSLTDSLTRLPNRRNLDAMGQRFWSQAQRNNQTLVLFMMDIDLFKSYNDTYGHPAGDDVLIKVASMLNEYARRPADLVARYGGEEFAMIMSETTIEHAKQTAQLILKRIEKENIIHAASPLGRISISIGIAVAKPNKENELTDLYGQADQALYRAKETGRNRVVFYDVEDFGGNV